MPNSPSARKRQRQNEVRRVHNRAVKSSVRTLVRKVRTAINEGDVEASQNAFKEATVSLDRAASRKVIHKNLAARTKSRLSKAIKKIKAGASA